MFDTSTILSQDVLDSKTAKELRIICHGHELVNSIHTKLKKSDLIELLNEFYNNSLHEMTAKELRSIGTSFGMVGISKTNKTILISMIIAHCNNINDSVVAEELDLEEDADIDLSSDSGSESVSTSNDAITTDITVIHGAKERVIAYKAGDTIWDIHSQFQSVMYIPAHPGFTVNEMEVPNNTPVGPGDVIEFFKVKGDKG